MDEIWYASSTPFRTHRRWHVGVEVRKNTLVSICKRKYLLVPTNIRPYVEDSELFCKSCIKLIKENNGQS